MVHKIDIEFFETVLSKIEDIKDYTSFISDFLHEKKDIMSMLNKEVDKLYIENQMVFTGVTSKFLL
ncbi:hypothetical protein Q896_15435 [Listeria monocytogenes]|nr:hypothetical protein [Listeria monocytogenes]